MGDAWVIRPYESDDEGCLLSMWLRSYSRSEEIGEWLRARRVTAGVSRWFTSQASDEEHRQSQYYWAFHRPMVLGLLRGADTRVLCDPERVHTTDGAPSCIWAWACVSDGLVHYVAVKQEVLRSGKDLAAEMVADLLSDRLEAPQVMTFEQRELLRMGLVPPSWTLDAAWRHEARRATLWLERTSASMRAATIETMRCIEAASNDAQEKSA